MLYIIYTYVLHNNIIYVPILPFSYTKASQLCTLPAPCFFLLIYLRNFSVTAHRDDPPSMGDNKYIQYIQTTSTSLPVWETSTSPVSRD